MALEPYGCERADRRLVGQRQVDARDERCSSASPEARLPVLRHRSRGRLRGARRAPSCWAAPTACRRREEVLERARAARPERRRQPARPADRAAPGVLRSACWPRCSSCARAPAGRTGSWSTRRITCCRRRGTRRRALVAAGPASGLLLITVHPNKIAQPALDAVDVVLRDRARRGETLRGFAETRRSPGARGRGGRSRARGRSPPGGGDRGAAVPLPRQPAAFGAEAPRPQVRGRRAAARTRASTSAGRRRSSTCARRT